MQHAETHTDFVKLVVAAAAANQLVVVDFSAKWCKPCVALMPFLNRTAAAHPNVVFVKIDVDENTATTNAYSVRAMPTLLFILQNRIVERIAGAKQAEIYAAVVKFSAAAGARTTTADKTTTTTTATAVTEA